MHSQGANVDPRFSYNSYTQEQPMNDIPLTPLRTVSNQIPFSTPTHISQPSYTTQVPLTVPSSVPSTNSVPDMPVPPSPQFEEDSRSASSSQEKEKEWWELGYPKEIIVDCWRQLISELIGTALLIYLCTGTYLSLVHLNGIDGGSVIGIGLGCGIATLCISAMTYPISGGHLNPAITLAVVLIMKMKIFKGVMFIVAQITGSIIGAYLIQASIPPGVTLALKSGAPHINVNATTLVPQGNSLSVSNACFMDIFLSIFVILAFLMSSQFYQGISYAGFWLPLVYGSAVMCTSLFAAPLSGVGANPLRAFGPSIAGGDFDNHWLFWIAPLVGSIAGAVLYKILNFQKPIKPDD